MKKSICSFVGSIAVIFCLSSAGCQPANHDGTCDDQDPKCLMNLSLSKNEIIAGKFSFPVSPNKVPVSILRQGDLSLSLQETIATDGITVHTVWDAQAAQAVGFQPGPAQFFDILIEFNGSAFSSIKQGIVRNVTLNP